MDFIPNQENRAEKVPFFEDARSSDGWAGHATTKTEDELKGEVSAIMGKLGGMVYDYAEGTFGNRCGYRVYFNFKGGVPGQMDVVALPLRTKIMARGYENKRQASLRMALFNLRNNLASMWLFQQIVPGYHGLLQMMVIGDKTVGQLMIEKLDAQMMLPAVVSGDGDVVDGDFEVT